MRQLWSGIGRHFLEMAGGLILLAVVVAVVAGIVTIWRDATSDASNAPAHRDPDDIPYPPARALSKYLHEGWELKTIVVDPATEPKNGGFPYAALRSAVLQKNGDILICEISFVSSTDGFKTDWCLPLK
jgi:hypothetical protein